MSPLPHALSVAAALLLVGCAESAVDPQGGPDDADDPTIKDAPTFIADIQPIIDRYTCSASFCHGAGQGNLFLSSDANANYLQLVKRSC